MGYLIAQIVLCLLIAAALGFFIGWFLRGYFCDQKIAELESAGTAASPAGGALESKIDTLMDRFAALEASLASGTVRDDLTRIEGIGPKIQQLLNDAGILTWGQLATAPVDRLKNILHLAGERFQIHDPTSWPDQAKLAAEGRWDELDELQDILQGGRDS
jgi:predicted flap endonuclease-1-like 5' DNA nuclease